MKQLEGMCFNQSITQMGPYLIGFDIGSSSVKAALVNADTKTVIGITHYPETEMEIGNQAFKNIGEGKCLGHLLNSPGNFTMSKLKWVSDNEPDIFNKIDKFMLPGDYMAMKMTGEIKTTIPGLSEAMLWDFKNNKLAEFILSYYGFDGSLVPDIVPTFSDQGTLQSTPASQLGLKAGIKVTYRAGDQPNNALSLNALEPGEIAATGGTSGVVYAIVDKPLYDPKSRVNGFAHVNHSFDEPRIGILLCVSGAGSQYRWVREQMAEEGTTYNDMERMITSVPVSSEGLRIIPFGNGAERILENKDLGSHITNLQFNRHRKAHFYRAALEGIAFAFAYGIEILNNMGIKPNVMRAGKDNLFQSLVFSTTISALTNCQIEVIETTGAVGAAFASGVGVGKYADIRQAMSGLKSYIKYDPPKDDEIYKNAYELWKSDLNKLLIK